MSYLRIKIRTNSVFRGVMIAVSIISVCHHLWLLCDYFSQYEKAWKDTKNIPFIGKSQEPVELVNYYREYTYDEASSYHGPILESWPPSRSRSIKPYINYSFTHHPEGDDLFNKTVLIMVQSQPSERNYRDNWRVVMKRQYNKNVAVIFVLGKDKSFGVKEERKLLTEIYRHQDIVQISELVEHYDNLTLKSLYSLKFFLSYDLFQFGTIPKYMLKVDMDVYVNIPKLLHLLTKDEEILQNEILLMGRCLCCGGESNIHCRKQNFGDLEEENGGIRFHWQIPSYLYNGENYPSYLQGPGYIMSRKAANCIFQKAQETPYFPLEDVYVTGFVAQECGIKRQHNSHFTEKWMENFENDEHIVYHLDCGAKVSKIERKKNYCHNGIKLISEKFAHAS